MPPVAFDRRAAPARAAAKGVAPRPSANRAARCAKTKRSGLIPTKGHARLRALVSAPFPWTAIRPAAVLAVKGPLRRAQNRRAPLTAPGRREENLPRRGKGGADLGSS